jgi:WD40 repeat protein
MSSGSERRLLPGDQNPIRSVAFSPDGEIVAAGTGTNMIELWDLVSNHPAEALNEHTDAVNSVAFSPDGHTLVSASSDKTVKLWSVTNFRWDRYIRP